MKRVINTTNAPAALGPYSQAIEANGVLYVSGQIPFVPATMTLVSEDVEEQTKQSLENIGAILKEAGYDFKDVVSATVYIKDMNDFAKINWVTHLPIMYSFWSKLLLGEGDYRGNPFQKHIPLPIESHHFDRWVELFKQNIDEQFIGEIAEEAKLRAENIAYVFDNKLSMLKLEY